MNNLNEAWEELLNPGEWNTYTLHNYSIPEDYHYATINSQFIPNPNEREFKRALADYCLMNSENLSKSNYSLIIGREREGFRFQTAYNGTWEEVSAFENKLALEKVCGNTDWSELQEQKKLLISAQEAFKPLLNREKEVDAIEGILNFIDHIQDFAVDKALLDEKIVFPGLERDDEDNEPTSIIDQNMDYIIHHEDSSIDVIKSGADIQERLHSILEDTHEVDEVDILSVIRLTPVAYKVTYKYLDEIGSTTQSVTLIPTNIY